MTSARTLHPPGTGGTPLGALRWRVTLPATRGQTSLSPDLLRVVPSTPGAPKAEVETVRAPRPGSSDGWEVVIALDPGSGHDPGPHQYVIEVDGQPGLRYQVRLQVTQPEEPGRAIGALGPGPRPEIDYTARDFGALNTLIVAVLGDTPGPQLASHVVSQAAALVDLLAYLGDNLSFAQDAVATEAYLASARRRISATRHAALLDYPVRPAVSARTWAHVTVTAPTVLPAGTVLYTDLGVRQAERPGKEHLEQAVAYGALIFETRAQAALRPVAPIDLDPNVHRGGAVEGGATSVTVAGAAAVTAGSLVLVAPERLPGAGWAGPPVPGAGFVVRLTEVAAVAAAPAGAGPATVLRWASEDAFPTDAGAIPDRLRVWPGNLVLADHGCTLPRVAQLPLPLAGERYWPLLPWRGVAFTRPAVASDAAGPAWRALAADGHPVAAVSLVEQAGTGRRRWEIRGSLLESGPGDPHAVLEVESDGTARLRFGDGTNGMVPKPGTRFSVSVRVGGGAVGNISALAVRGALTDDPLVIAVRNPVPAIGGTDQEAITSIKLNAPAAARDNDRAVTPADYERAARRVPGVLDAQMVPVPNGTWPVAVVYILGKSWEPDNDVLQAARDALAPLALIGVELDVRPAIALPVTVEASVVVERGYANALVGGQVDAALSRKFLQPGRFGFAKALYESDVVSALFDVKGVVDATISTFAVAPGPSGWRQAGGVLKPPSGRVLRIDNDPTTPGNGVMTYTLRPEL